MLNRMIRESRFDNTLLQRFYFNLFPKRYIDHYKPLQLVIFEVSSHCNLKCPFCVQSLRKDGRHMTLQEACRHISKLPDSVKVAQLHFSGESFLNPDIAKIAARFRERGIYTTVCTNGTLPPERYTETLRLGLNELVFAIDGATPEAHETYRIGSNFQKIIATLQQVVESKPDHARIGVQFLVTRFNEQQIPQMKELLTGIGVDFFNLKTLSLDIASDETLERHRLDQAARFLPVNSSFSRYRIRKGKLMLKDPVIVCPFIFQPVVGAEGGVYLCCIDIGKKTPVGRLEEYSAFADLWQSAHYRGLRKRVLNKKLPICRTCNYCLSKLQKVIG